MKTPIEKLPNEGLKKLAKERPDVVERMGFEVGGIVKGQSCPHRSGGVRGTGAAVQGAKFIGVK